VISTLPTVLAREIQEVILTITAMRLDTYSYTFSSNAITPALFKGGDFSQPFPS